MSGIIAARSSSSSRISPSTPRPLPSTAAGLKPQHSWSQTGVEFIRRDGRLEPLRVFLLPHHTHAWDHNGDYIHATTVSLGDRPVFGRGAGGTGMGPDTRRPGGPVPGSLLATGRQPGWRHRQGGSPDLGAIG